MKLQFTRVMNALTPMGEDAQGWLNKIKAGGVVTAEFRVKQNSAFHKKMFALLKVGFDNWKQPEVEVEVGKRKVHPEKNFTRFRKDLTILAGYYDVVFRLDGSHRIEAQSLSFDSMPPEDRENIYSKFIDVLLANVYQGYSREDVDKMVETYLAFA